MGTNEHVSDSEREEPIKDSEELQDKAEDSGQTEAEMQTEAQNAGTEDSAGETAEDGGEKEDGDAKYLRLAADFQNFRRRVEKEKSDIYAYANEKIALDIIDVMDNFERALQHSEECADKQFVEGIGKIYKQLKSVLDKNNIVEIKAEG